MASPRTPCELRLTDRDLRMLAFMAEHHQVIERQLAALVVSSPDRIRRRLARLTQAGYTARNRAFPESSFSIRPRGLGAIGSDLPPPEPNAISFRHDVGLAGLWLAARTGAFGPVSTVIGERRIRSHDEATTSADELYAVRLGGVTEHGRERRHYPDLLLIDRVGRRLALELELSDKGANRREEIVAGYGADRRLDGVIYLVENGSRGRRIGRAIAASAVRAGLSDRVHVRRLVPITPGPAAPRVTSTMRTRRQGVAGRDAGR